MYLYKPSADLVGKTLHDVFSKEEADRFLAHIHRALDEGSMHRVEYSLPIERAQVWFEGSVSPMSKDEVLWVARDVTERKHAEELIQLQATALEAAANAIAITDAEGAITWVNPAFTVMTGYGLDDVLGHNPNILKSGVHDPTFYEALWKTVLSGQVWHGEMTNRRKDGGLYYQDQTITPVMNDAGDITHFVSIQQDITQRKQAEAALSRTEEKYRTIFENAVDGIYQATPEGKFTSVNPAMVRILGYKSQEELAAHRVESDSRRYVDPNCHEKLKATLAEKGVVVGFECEVYRKDLSKLWISQNVRAIRDESGNVLVHEGSIEDITERKTLEEQFRQAQKMEAVGKLAGGVAHDFNNLLTAIIGYSDLNLQQLRPGDPLRSDIEEIKKAGQRASSLTRQLLAFSRKQVLEPRVLDLNHTVSDMHKMLQRLIGEDIQLETVLDAALGSVKADPGQLEQVLMNLAVNARDAMPDGGKLTIETANVELDQHYASDHVMVKPGPHVMLAISDTGCGMDRQTQARIFEPFFTTKAIGHGTGLGLSTVYGIVKQSGGSIWVYSEVGKGTTFKIYLPTVDEKVREFEQTAARAEFPRGTETILLAEDDETVRKLTTVVLRTQGYQVLEAVNGDAALSICERFEGEIHLLLSDVVMPEMSGRELVHRLAGMRPEMRVLYMSGYTANAMIQQGGLQGKVNFLQKPFTPSALAQKVREILGKPPTAEPD